MLTDCRHDIQKASQTPVYNLTEESLTWRRRWHKQTRKDSDLLKYCCLPFWDPEILLLTVLRSGDTFTYSS